MARGEGRKDRRSGTFGSVDKLATGYRARYFGPDGRRYKAPTLFQRKQDARAWLSLRHAEIIRNAWSPPDAEDLRPSRTTLKVYSDQWMAHRDLKSRTAEHYRKLLDNQILPSLGSLPINSIKPEDVRAWYAALGDSKPTLRSHAYGLLRTILGTATGDGVIPMNPCTIRGAGNAKRAHRIRPATLDEIATITEAMPEQYQAMVLLAAWCALRFGELTELRRRDITIDETDPQDAYGVVRIERAVVRTASGFQVTTPKSDAGRRDVEIPPHLLSAIKDHLSRHVEPGRDALLFPAAQGGHLAPASLYRRFYAAREAAERNDLRWHDLRHSGAVLAAATGATLAELMARLGHSTPGAAMRYQHSAQGRDRQIAKLLSGLARPGDT